MRSPSPAAACCTCRVLIETMRREGYELSVGKPQVIMRERKGVTEEPFESLVVEVPHDKLGAVMEMVGARRGQTGRNEQPRRIRARRVFDSRPRADRPAHAAAECHARHGDHAPPLRGYRPLEGEIAGRANGVLVSMAAGKAVAFGLDGLQERAEMFVGPGDVVYEGMIVGENSRTGDMAVNPTKEKKLTNMRATRQRPQHPAQAAAGADARSGARIHRRDELVEVTPGRSACAKFS